MPLRVQNYGEWDGERRNQRGYHPPACTCYSCNEAKRQGGREIQNQPPIASSPAAVQPAAAAEPAAAAQPAAAARPAASRPAGTRPARRPLRAVGRVVGAALRYAVALHVVTVAGLVVYAIVQDGAGGVAPALSAAWDAYVGAWAAGVRAVTG